MTYPYLKAPPQQPTPEDAKPRPKIEEMEEEREVNPLEELE